MTTYVCAALDANGQCLQWIEQSSGNVNVTPEQVWNAFQMGFGIVFATWSIGFTVSVVLSMIRKTTV